MKTKTFILLASCVCISSCCNVVGIFPLNEDNDAVVKLMTTETVPELEAVEIWTQNKKASLEATSIEFANLRLTYNSLHPKVEALSVALQNDFKMGEKKPTSMSIQAAKNLAKSINDFKAANGETSLLSLDWTSILVGVFKPLVDKQIQKQRV